MVQAPGVGPRPIWDTETSWGGAGAITDPNQRAGFVARSFLLHWSAGIHNMYWYGWDSPVWGTLYYSPTGTPPGIGMSPAAYAYQYTYDWMVGASMPLPCTANGGSTYSAVYTCQLTRPGGYQAMAVWDTNQTCRWRLHLFKLHAARAIHAVSGLERRSYYYHGRPNDPDRRGTDSAGEYHCTFRLRECPSSAPAGSALQLLPRWRETRLWRRRRAM